MHTRTPFELRTAAGIAAYRSFVEEAADLVVSYGGSLSGEHGDGQSRGELLPKMFGPELIRAFGEMKDVFDPERAGFQVEVPVRSLCCGLTWISTGQLGMAARMLRRTIWALRPELRAGVPVVVLEPSCAAVFRSDAAELLGSDDARLLAERTKTLAELLTEAGWYPDGLLESLRRDDPGGDRSRRAIAQVHCHQHAIMGFDPDTEILRSDVAPSSISSGVPSGGAEHPGLVRVGQHHGPARGMDLGGHRFRRGLGLAYRPGQLVRLLAVRTDRELAAQLARPLDVHDDPAGDLARRAAGRSAAG